MLTLYSLGDTELIYVLGNTRFVMIYLLGGLFSSFSHILCEKYIESSYLNTFYSKNFIYKSFNPIILESSAHGASGCIRALTSFFSMIYPQALISFFFIPIPIPAILVCILEIIWDFWNLMETVPNNSFINSTTISRKFISHAGHLGGTFAGFLFYLFIKKFR
jgi:membrane associated rhomboid family serine protease